MEDFQPLRSYNLDIKNKRVFVVSDIHGNSDLLKRIINDIDLDSSILIILGDISARGKDPLVTLEMVMELSKHPNVYITLGNCDQADYISLRESELERFKHQLSRDHYITSKLAQKYFNGSIPNMTDREYLDLQVKLYDKYTKYFDFLMDLNHCIITDKYLFTHAGVPVDANLKDDNYYSYIHSRDFYKKGHNLDKIVICGHIPSVIYNKEEFNDDPKFFKDKKIVMIDGGESIQLGAQINVLEINNEEIVGFKRYQDFEYVDIIKDQVSYTNYKGACWPFLQIELLEEIGKYFTLCKILGTLEVCYIKNEYITFDKEGYRVKDDCPSNFLNVKVNDKVMLIKKLDGYSLCKIDGSLGFINNECIKWS